MTEKSEKETTSKDKNEWSNYPEEISLDDEDEAALDRAWESPEVQAAVLREELDEIERSGGKEAREAAEARAKAYFAAQNR